MAKALVLAEKPSVASDYAKFLKCYKKEKGYWEGNNYVVTYALGHLLTLYEPQDYNENLKKWNIDDLPIIPEKFKIKLIEKTKGQFYIIKKLINRSDINAIINGGDCGSEGELIQRYILLYSGNTKPVKRLWIDDMTPKSLKKGFDNLKDSKEFDNYYYAASTRAKTDWIIGMNYSRVYTLKLKSKSVLSIGRCQTPILNLIVKRDLEKENFKSQPFYEVVADLRKIKATYIDKDNNTRIFDKKIAEDISEEVKTRIANIKDIKKEHKKIRPPQLFTLTDLQKTMSNKYGFTEDKTLKIAQSLYETHKILSYPRTSSNYLTDNIAEEFKDMLNVLNFNKFSSIIEKISESNIEKIKADKRFVDNKKVEDHYALIPTLNKNIENIYNNLSADEKIEFDEIVMRFLAVFYNDYEYDMTTTFINIYNYNFISKYKLINKNGWKAIYNDSEEEIKEEENNIIENNTLEKNDKLDVKETKIIPGKTKEPPSYTSATILSAMQKYGIGTEATRTNILQTLLKRGYIIRDKKNLQSTSLGKQVISSINIDEIKSVKLTSELEKNINNIIKGTDPRETFNKVSLILKNNIAELKNKDISAINYNQDVISKCPLCGGNILIKHNKKGTSFYGCSNYKKGCKFLVSENFCGGNITKKQIKLILEKGCSSTLSFNWKGKNFKRKVFYNKDINKLYFLKE